MKTPAHPRRSGAFLTAFLVALASFASLAAAPAQAQIDPGMLPVSGTWAQGSPATVAWVDLATWRLVTSAEGGTPAAGPEPQPWIPVAGDWDGDGVDSVQMFNVHTWELLPAEHGRPAASNEDPQPQPWLPVAGDWDGRGIDTVLVFDERDGSLHRLEEGPIPVERYDPSPNPWRPLAGDWDGDRIDTLAQVQDEVTASAPVPVWRTLAGDWDGDGIDTEARLHLPTGRLAKPEATTRAARSTAPTASMFDGFSTGPGPCYKLIKNKSTAHGKKYLQNGGYIEWCISTWEEWTCCPVGPGSWNVGCGMQLKFGTC